MRENHLCTKQEGKSLNKRGKRERSREGGREGGERVRKGREILGMKTYEIDMFGDSYGTPELQAPGGSCTIQ